MLEEGHMSSHEMVLQGTTSDDRSLDLVATATKLVSSFLGENDGIAKTQLATAIICQDVTALMSKDRDLQITQKVFKQFAHELRSKYACALNELEIVRGCVSESKDKKTMLEQELRACGVTDESLAASMTLLFEADQLIETRLNMHKIYKGVYETGPNVQIIDQASLLASRITIAKALASSSHKVSYEVTTPEALENATLKLDCYIFTHIANNLLSNARKHTTTGTVGLGFIAPSDDGKLIFAVTDTGRGIPDHMKAKLFQEEVASADVRGTGLGLMSCRVFSEAIGGSCWLEATTIHDPNDDAIVSGTEFRFSLPGTIVAKEVLASEGEDSNGSSGNSDDSAGTSPVSMPPHLRAFIVEDSTFLRRSISTKLRNVLRAAGTHVDIVEHETIESILHTIGDFKDDPNVIVTVDQNLDSQGGVLKGSDLVNALGRANYAGLLVSCSGDEEVGAEHLALGADLVWGKPLPNSRVLLASLQRFYSQRQSATLFNSPTPSSCRPSPSPQRKDPVTGLLCSPPAYPSPTI